MSKPRSSTVAILQGTVSDQNSSSEPRSTYSTMQVPPRRPTIGIRCTNIEVGAQFYREVQALMAQLYPLEYNRPKIFLDLGGNDDTSSALLGQHRKKFDMVLVPHLLDKKEEKAFTPEQFIQQLYSNRTKYPDDAVRKLQILNKGSNPFVNFGVHIVDQEKFQHEAKTKGAAVVGIVGGMGPEADGYTLGRLAEDAKRNHTQESLRVYLMSDPRVPRTFGQVANVHKLKYYKNRLQKFLRIGEVNTFIVPSNTFHTGVQYGWAQDKCGGKILSIIDAVANAATEFKGQSIGLLATQTTMNSGIYPPRLKKAGANVIEPSVEDQVKAHAGIVAMKNGDMVEAKRLFIEVIKNLIAKGAEVILLGCTEIPLALEEELKKAVLSKELPQEAANGKAMRYIDSADILGRAVSKHAQAIVHDPLISCVQKSLNEYYSKNAKELGIGGSRNVGRERYLKLYKAMKAANGNPENYQKFKQMINDIISGQDYSVLHKRRSDGLDSILEKNMSAFQLKFKSEGEQQRENQEIAERVAHKASYLRR